MSDERLKKNLSAGRETRAMQDASRGAPEDSFASASQRRSFRNEFMQEALPTPPEIPGYHLCWLSTTNSYDPIHKRMRLGYEAVRSDELKGFDHLKVTGDDPQAGMIRCNEMVLYKLPMDIYQSYMQETHHYAPMDEQDKIRVQQDQLVGAKDSNGKRLVTIEGGIQDQNNIRTPVFD